MRGLGLMKEKAYFLERERVVSKSKINMAQYLFG